MLLQTLASLLQQITDVYSIKSFLQLYSHPLYPEKHYVDPYVYFEAKTVSDLLWSMFPMHINSLDHCLLKEIVHRWGNDECKNHYQRYEQTMKRLERKLRHYPAPVTDSIIEQCKSQNRLKICFHCDFTQTKPRDIQTVQKAIMQTTGIDQIGLVFASQDLCNPVVFNFLIPNSFVQLFSELCDDDLTILQSAGITMIKLDKLEIDIDKTLSFRAHTTRKQVNPSNSEYFHMQRWLKRSNQELLTMLNMISDSQMNEVCSEDLLREFSFCIQEWETLAPLQHFDSNYSIRYLRDTEMYYKILLDWKCREGNKATYRHLMEVVLAHGTSEEVRALTQIPLRG